MSTKIGKALVVGAGISGIRAALDLAENGYRVTLIDRAPHIGGVLSQLDYQFPTDKCGMCKMLPLVDRDASSQFCLRKGLFHENIQILLSTELTALEGEPGRFKATLKEKPVSVDPKLCVGCAECVKVCPVEVPDAFNAGFSRRKAIYLPVPHAIPNTYVIDFVACSRCGACVDVCPTNAICIADEDRKKFRILVVDDELIVRDSLKEWLEDEGFTVQMAASGPEALEILSKEPFQLMLVDIKMPGMDGVELLKRSMEIDSDMSVVMMTAYATVETAVEALTAGALDYLIKPFDPETLIPMVSKIYEDQEASHRESLEIGAVVLAGGTSYFDPSTGKNTFGYKVYPNVVTSLEFERILSGTGPTHGRLIRPSDGKPVKKVAWIQCVGSRNLQTEADFCSSVCCMFSIKEAMLCRGKIGEVSDTVIFYMDMRAFEKPFQSYLDRAIASGVRFERGKVHTVEALGETGDLLIHHIDQNGRKKEETFDMVVLAVGQRPAPGTQILSENLQIELNPWGFIKTDSFFPTRSNRNGVYIGGAFSGLKDISESVIYSSAASLEASLAIHNAGGSLAPEPSLSDKPFRDVETEMPRVLVVICSCGQSLSPLFNEVELTRHLEEDPAVIRVKFISQICTAEGWDELTGLVRSADVNRILIGACIPYVYTGKLKELGEQTGLDSKLMDVVDIRTPSFRMVKTETEGAESENHDDLPFGETMEKILNMGVSKIKHMDPAPVQRIEVIQKALVVGGGIAGMVAALGIADHGYWVDLVEKNDRLGGNLTWLDQTIEGENAQELLNSTRQRVEGHPKIQIHLKTQVAGAYGQVGHFFTTLSNEEGTVETIKHGTTIFATGGNEAKTEEYAYGQSPAVVTQKELEQKFSESSFDPASLSSVVMIQCVGSRQEPRNYCSRICCASALKNAFALKEKNPEINIFVLYRDVMAYGFLETFYTEARKKGIIFIPYDLDRKANVRINEDANSSSPPALVEVFEPTIGRNLEIEADLVVLATGIEPAFSKDMAENYGASLDDYGFFREAESKWRPVDSITEGIFACGITLSPRSISESIATAQAAAQRSVRILSRQWLPTGKLVAQVRHSLCSLCQRCIDVCPYGARILEPELDRIVVNPARCQGCGACAAVCPNSASVLSGCSDQAMMEIIDSALFG
ncbi:MAG: FAD-dependent oxidoreductase [Desulfobacterales bacterium]